MARGTRTIYSGKRNKGLSSTFQPPEEGWSVLRSKCCDKHGDKDEDNILKNVNNVHNTSYQKYRQILKWYSYSCYSSRLFSSVCCFPVCSLFVNAVSGCCNSFFDLFNVVLLKFLYWWIYAILNPGESSFSNFSDIESVNIYFWHI